MESTGCKDGTDSNAVVSSKLRSPNRVNDSNTMDSFQDGGQQNMNSEQNDFPPPLDGPHLNSDMNNFPPRPGDQGMPSDGYDRMNEGPTNPAQMQGYGYNRANYNMGDQHGGLTMAGSMDYSTPSSQYPGQYPQSGMRSGYSGGPKPGMGPSRSGMGVPAMGMMPPGYNSVPTRMMSGQSIAQQGGPTPTLNQLLQTPNSTQRFQGNNYSDYGGGGGSPKHGGDMGGDSPYGVQQGWPSSQRPINPYSQGGMSANVPYRNQSGPMPPEMNQARRPSGMPPSYPSQSGQYGGQQYSPNSQRFPMMSNQGRMMPGQMGGMGQQYNQQMTPQYGHHHQGQMGYNSQPMTPQQQPIPPPLQQSPQPGPQSSQQTSGPYLSPPQSGPQPPLSSGGTPGGSGNTPGGSGSPSSQTSPQQAPQHQQQQRVTPPLVKPLAQRAQPPNLIPQSHGQKPSQQQQQQQQLQPSGGQAGIQQPQPSPEQGFSNSRPPSNKPSNTDSDSVEANSNFEEANNEGGRLGTPPSSSSGGQHPSHSTLRPIPSPAGSTGSRSNTPASVPGTQAGSPMPPRPSSRQLDGQNRMSSQSPMPTGYNQQMMPPPMGPNQMGYGSGNKVGGGPQMGPQMGHYPPYNSQFHQGNYPRQAGPGPGPGPSSGMQGYNPQQNTFNGPNQMSGNSMYGGMGANRNMPPNMLGAGYYNNQPGNSIHLGSNQYGGQPNFNTNNSHTSSGSNSSGMGSTVGTPMGTTVAAPMGSTVAAPMGSTVAAPMGSTVAAPMGSTVAAPMGSTVAAQMGSTVAAPMGSTVAAPMGSTVAAPMGSTVAAPMGSTVGGSTVAAPMGSVVGAPMGSMVGTPMGSQMGPPANSGTVTGSTSPSSAKGAQAAAQAAMLAAANSAVNRPQPSVRPVTSPMTNHQRMYSPHPSMNQMNPMGSSVNSTMGGYPGMPNHMPNSHQSVNQMPNSVSQSSVPSSMNQMPNSTSSSCSPMSNSTGMPGMGMMPHTGMSSSGNMPNSSGVPNMSMPNTSMPGHTAGSAGGMPSMPSSHPSSHMANVGMPPFSGFSTNSNNPLSNMASMSAGIMSSNPPGSGIPNTSNTGPSSSNAITSLPPGGVSNATSSDSGMSSGSSSSGGLKSGSPSLSVQRSMTPHSMDGDQQNSATPPSSSSTSGQSSIIPGDHGCPPMSSSSTSLPSSVSSSSQAPFTYPALPMANNSSNINCTAANDDEIKPPTTTTNTNSGTTCTVVTQSITSPVTSIAETSNSSSIDAQTDVVPSQPIISTPVVMDDPPERKKKESVYLPPTPVGIAPSPGAGSVSSLHEDLDNISSPSCPGTPKSGTPDLSKLFEMGDEPERRPFLENLLLYLEDKGTPVTAMPSISKQPLDLYKLYLQVRDKGGMVEVTKTKKWKEICGVVNIGASASAAFTLKKNYIKYLFNYECKYDKGGIDPAPILALMEAALQQKRESKNRARAPSPAGSQGSQDAFRPPSTPNSQGMDSFPPSMQPPGGYMGNDVGGMGPMGNNMMTHNSMMNNMGGPGHGNMMPPGGMGPMQPHSGIPHPQGMGGSGVCIQGVLSPSNMMPHNNFVSNNMMSSGGGGGGPAPVSNNMPPPASNTNMMPNSADSISVQDPFADEPNMANAQYPRFGVGNNNHQMPFSNNSSSSGMQPTGNMPPSNMPPSNMPPSNLPPSNLPPGNMPPGTTFNQYGPRPGINSSNVPVPPYSGSSSQSGMNNDSSGMNRVPPQGEPGFNESYRRPTGPADGNFSGNQGNDPYNNSSNSSSSSGQFTGNRMNQSGMPASGGPYPYGQQPYDRERFEQQGSMGPPGPQPFRSLSHSQVNLNAMPPQQQQPQQHPDQMYPGRYGNQQMSQRPPQQNQFNQQQQSPFPNQVSGFPTSSKSLSGHEPYQRYPTPPPPHQQQPSTPQPSQASPYPNQRAMPGVRDLSSSMYSTPPKRYPDMDRRDGYNMPPAYGPYPSMYGEKSAHIGSPYHRGQAMMPTHHDGQMSDSRRDPSGQWSPMSHRYPPQHPGSPYSGPSMGNMAPGHHPNMAYNRMTRQMSPQRERQYFSPPKMQKPGMMPNAHFIPKKEIIFPPDSVEATQPLLAKRKKLHSKDLGQIEAWRLMMALKSGLLAESTWALDALTVMMYDDSTLAYFGLVHLQGLLEVLLEHFRQCLVQIFHQFEELEIGYKPALNSPSNNTTTSKKVKVEEGVVLTRTPTPIETNPLNSARLSVPENPAGQDTFRWENYTYISRHGKTVKVEEISKDAALMADTREWDKFVGFTSGSYHWAIGHGESTQHIITHFESGDNLSAMRKLFFKWIKRNSRTAETRTECNSELGDKHEDCEDSENCDVFNSGHENSEIMKDNTEVTEETTTTKDSDGSKTNCVCEQTIIQNDFMKVHIKSEPVDFNLIDMEIDRTEAKVSDDKKSKDSSQNSRETPTDSEDSQSEEISQMKEADKSEADAGLRSKESNESTEPECTDQDNSSVKSESLESDSWKLSIERFNKQKNATDMLRGFKRSLEGGVEEEAYQRDEPALCLTSMSREEVSRRCICVSNILRSLSFVPGNDTEMSKHAGLLYVLGKLLLVEHHHQKQVKPRPKLDHEEPFMEEIVDLRHGEDGWWWDCLNALRENTFVTLANISGKLNLSKFPEEVCMPMLDGLLHWAVCPSACAQDPLPTMPSTSVLSPHRLVLETMCKLSIQEANVDLMLATPPFNRIIQLFSNLCNLLANKKQQVTQEFAIVLLAALVQGDSSAARAIAMQHPCISLLIDFLETAEQNALQVANTHGVQMLRDNPETMGTSLDMLRRSATTLVYMARVPENRTLFIHHQSRLLALVMSQILDQHVAQILAEVLYECSLS